MADHTHIEWTDATWNPLRGCSRVSAGCQHCYAERVAGRFDGAGQPYEGLIHPKTGGWNGQIKLVPEALQIPWRWSRGRRIFVNSMSDLFHEAVPFEFIAAVFWVMSHTTRHTYQVLTKRPQRALAFFNWLLTQVDEELGYEPGETDFLYPDGHPERGWRMSDGLDHAADKVPAIKALGWTPATKTRGGYDNCGPGWPYANVWLGVSVEDQATADERIPLLLQCPAAVRWISAEPLLGPVDLRYLQPRDPPTEINAVDGTHGVLRPHGGTCGRLDWVVVGGESGPGARPMHPDWARALRDQCAAAGVPFLFKQWGAWEPHTPTAGGDLGGDLRRGEVQQVRAVGELDGHLRRGDVYMRHVGKKRAGRHLDGVLHDGYPP